MQRRALAWSNDWFHAPCRRLCGTAARKGGHGSERIGANLVAVAEQVRVEVTAMQHVVADRDVRLTITDDQAPFIEGSFRDVQLDLVLGAILAIVIILEPGKTPLRAAAAAPPRSVWPCSPRRPRSSRCSRRLR